MTVLHLYFEVWAWTDQGFQDWGCNCENSGDLCPFWHISDYLRTPPISTSIFFFTPGFAIPVDPLFRWPTFASAANVVPRDSRVDFDIKSLPKKTLSPVNCAQGKSDSIHHETLKIYVEPRDSNATICSKRLQSWLCHQETSGSTFATELTF